MFSGLYNTGILAYQLILRLAAPFSPKARLWVNGRRHWLTNLTQKITADTALANPAHDSQQRPPIAWFHAASLGEFEQGRPVIETFRAQYPHYKILLTFFSPSGYEVRRQYAGADYILYLPADTPDNARQFVSLVKPAIAFFIKYEFWYNYLHELKAAHVPTVSFSAIFRPGQLFFKPYGGFYRDLLRHFDCILVQNQESVDLLKSIGVAQAMKAGDTRFDRVAQVAAARKAIPIAHAFKWGSANVPQPVLVIGSAWQADMDVLIPFLNGFEPPLKVIVAPHEIHDAEIERWRNQLKKRSVRFSQTNETDVPTADVLFVDNVGMLSSLYQYGEFAYVGGAFGKGLHNILEAATFGMPLFFGPHYPKFQEAIDLVNEGAAFSISSPDELASAFDRQYADRAQAADRSRNYVQRNIGATAQVMKVVQKFLP